MATLLETQTKPRYSYHHHHQTTTGTTASVSCSIDDGKTQPIQIQPAKSVQSQASTPLSTSAHDGKSTFIDADEMKSCLQSLSTVILDCRVLKDYELNHIKNSIHINCRDKITRKRLSSKKLTVKDIINCENAKSKLNEKLIVIYDERTNDQNDLLYDWNPLKIVMDNLKQSCNTKICRILKGGFNEFREKCPELCEQNSSSAALLGLNLTNPCVLSTKSFFNFNIQCPLAAAVAAYNSEADQLCAGLENIESAKMTQILPHLYLGNECDSKNEKLLEAENIYYILNVTKTLPCYFETTNKKFKYMRIAVNDACNENLKQYFEQAEHFIDEAKEKNSKILVHCQAGISRSPTIVIAYLMKKLNLKMNDAYNLVREKRCIIGPNLIFMSQLSDYEDRLCKPSVQPCKNPINIHSTSSLTGIAAASGTNDNGIKQLAANTLTCMLKPLFH